MLHTMTSHKYVYECSCACLMHHAVIVLIRYRLLPIDYLLLITCYQLLVIDYLL